MSNFEKAILKKVLLENLDITFWCSLKQHALKDFFSKCDQIRRKVQIWSHLLKKSLIENFIFCAVLKLYFLELKEKNYFNIFAETCSFALNILVASTCKFFLMDVHSFVFTQ